MQIPDDQSILAAMDAMRSIGIEPSSLERQRQVLHKLVSRLTHEAMESDTTDPIPSDVLALTALAEAATGSIISAIKPASYTTFELAGPLPNGLSKLDWHMCRLGLDRALAAKWGRKMPHQVAVQHDGFAMITAGNPIQLEGWFRAQGLGASAQTPTCCIMEWPKPCAIVEGAPQ